MSNFKASHFDKASGVAHKAESLEVFTEKLNAQKFCEEDLLMERQAHACDCRDKEFEKMKSEVRIRISKQIANKEVARLADKKELGETNTVYEKFVRQRRGTELSGQPDLSDISHSGSLKPSHDISHYNNTRRLH